MPRASGRRALLKHSDVPKLPVDRYDWHISFRKAAPDCFEKNVLVVNGKFQPELRVKRGTMLEVTVYNDLPDNYPSITDGGISIHWHGLSLVGYPWYDGVAFVQQCPIMPGQNFTYRFPITDAPGTYFWHDHASGNHADGLSGPLIIEPADGVPPYNQYDEEKTVFIHDWFHAQGDVLAMGLNRPFVPADQTVGRGAWSWVNSAQSILLNGHAYYGDCTMTFPASANSTSCGVQRLKVEPGLAGQPMASAANPGCRHMEMDVEAGRTYLIRVVGAGTISMVSICFGGHDVQVVAADATPIDPITVKCVDVNLGQRYDLLLTANQTAGNYWITAAGQYRPGTPYSYGVLRYAGANQTALPPGQPPNVGTVQPWSLETINSIHTRDVLLNATTAKPYDFPFPGRQTTLGVPRGGRLKRFSVEISQPALVTGGQLRWDINNIAHADVPVCASLLEDIYRNASYLRDTAVLNGSRSSNGVLGKENSGDTDIGRGTYLDTVRSGPQPIVTNATGPEDFPPEPVAGRHIVTVKIGDLVDVLVQNNNSTSFGGNPPGLMRNATSEQHPFHLHGHHFWLLGTGLGNYDPANVTLNLMNPAYRDTATVPQNGWVLFRFLADNRGIWLLHCHIFWHQFMGQAIAFAAGVDQLPKPPAHLPECPASCPAQFAPWRPQYVLRKFRDTPYEIPLPGVLPTPAPTAAAASAGGSR